MPPKYFAFVDGEQKGPFTPDQLIDIGIHPSTYVWSKEMSDWQRADSVEEIRRLFRNHLEKKKEKSAALSSPSPDKVGNRPAPDPSATPPRGGRFGFQLPEVEEEPDLNRPPQVSMTLAILSLLFCFPLSGIVAVIYAYKAQKTWEEATGWQAGVKTDSDALRRKAHDYERLAKMWLGLTLAFGIIFWTLIFSVR